MSQKDDAHKSRPSLVIGGFSKALQEISKLATFGAAKYSDGGWLTVPFGQQRYLDAMLRHQLSEFDGNKLDSETGMHQATHIAWNALARLELILREENDRAR